MNKTLNLVKQSKAKWLAGRWSEMIWNFFYISMRWLKKVTQRTKDAFDYFFCLLMALLWPISCIFFPRFSFDFSSGFPSDFLDALIALVVFTNNVSAIWCSCGYCLSTIFFVVAFLLLARMLLLLFYATLALAVAVAVVYSIFSI